MTLSAVLEEDVLRLEDELFCENGKFKWHNHVYHDHKPHGWLSFRDVIKHSSNIGTMKSAIKLGENRLYRYIRRFGLGKKTGIGLPGEVTGITRHPNKWSSLSLCSISMGQELTVTSIQLACAISSLANGGYFVRPRIVDRVQDKTGNVIRRFKPKRLQRVVSENAARAARKVLRGVVEEGTGKLAEVKGYFPAGKTGTAQKVESNGTYSHRRFMASFIGLLPFDDPRFVIVVVMDEPRPYYYGGTVCAPVFKEVASEGRHTFISTGMTNEEDIIKAVSAFRYANCPFTLMHCISTYPMKDEDANLNAIKTLREKYNCDVGYSGHEVGLAVSYAAAALGIAALERHITLDRAMYGSDQASSVEPAGFRMLVGAVRKIEKAMGTGELGYNKMEIPIAENLRQHLPWEASELK